MPRNYGGLDAWINRSDPAGKKTEDVEVTINGPGRSKPRAPNSAAASGLRADRRFYGLAHSRFPIP